ncbi:MAG: polysaccharide biosynthesis tyrosine autokinase [Dysgonamonadaceae bacterium]|jgi:capsular exopolysaccharide synthesis family protein|nr:polysaccharide biosynthesis tyrosine autokinase [Dysgonamonadaceae bacterium]
MENTTNNTQGGGLKEINLQWFIANILINWRWFALSIIVFLLSGYLYLRYATPVFNVYSKIFLQNSSRGQSSNSDAVVFQALGVLDNSSTLENEIELMRSRDMIENLIKETGLFIRYRVKGRFMDTELFDYGNRAFYKSLPIKVHVDSVVLSKLGGGIAIKASLTEDGDYLFTGFAGGGEFTYQTDVLPCVLKTLSGEILITEGEKSKLKKDCPVEINIVSPLSEAMSFIGRLELDGSNQKTSVISMTLRETHRSRGQFFLQKLIDFYNHESFSDKNKAAQSALNFIDERLLTLRSELDNAERQTEAYRVDNHISLLGVEGTIFLQGEDAMFQQYAEANAKDLILDYIKNDLLKQGTKDGWNLLPALSVQNFSPTLMQNITEFNNQVLTKQRIMREAVPELPAVRRMDLRLETLRTDILAGIDGLKHAIKEERVKLDNEDNIYESGTLDYPRRERELSVFSRQEAIKLGLVNSLSDRAEEIKLTLAVEVPNAKVLEYPLASGGPVSPHRMFIFLICLIFGVLTPFIIFGIREMFNYKLGREDEVRRFTNIPIIVSIPFVKTKTPLVVTQQSTSAIVERFRLLRTNLQFMLETPEKKVIMVTSTISGEGKTFVAINLAMTFSLKYKTILVGLDVRRPKINSYLNLPKQIGLISYLTGEEHDVDSLIYKNVNDSNLDVLVSGIVPPNPNELLIDKTLDNLFAELRKKYDYIIVDSSPVGSVSDAFLLNRVIDASLFVVRGDVTPKSALALANTINTDKRLANLSFVLNAFHSGKNKGYGYGYGYGGYGGYGYGGYGGGYGYGGYGYGGYGYGYGDSYGYGYSSSDD